MRFNRYFGYAALVFCVLIAACQSEPIGVPVHAVNYTEDEFTYRIVDPKDPENRAGGETINSFGAGGLMCCYTVPEKWLPGIKVELQVELWLTSQPNGPDGSPQRKQQIVTLDLPKPVEDEPSELWVIRTPDGAFDLVACNCGPSHERWPGKIKGMPIASQSYRQKLIRRELSEMEGVLCRFTALKQELDADPIPYSKENWEFRKEQGEASLLDAYKGPNDKRYIDLLKSEADEMVSYAAARIAKLKKGLQ